MINKHHVKQAVTDVAKADHAVFAVVMSLISPCNNFIPLKGGAGNGLLEADAARISFATPMAMISFTPAEFPAASRTLPHICATSLQKAIAYRWPAKPASAKLRVV